MLDQETLFQALVTSVEDSKKEASVNLGFIKGVIPIENMRWAQPVKAPAQPALNKSCDLLKPWQRAT